MGGRYVFTRAWGAIIAGVGWVVLVGAPVVAGLVIIVIEVQSQAVHVPNRALLFAASLLASLVVGLIIGGALIVAGQRLRIAVDSLHVQLAMLERLDALGAQRGDGTGGRFSGLAGE